jgi:plastocyanin
MNTKIIMFLAVLLVLIALYFFSRSYYPAPAATPQTQTVSGNTVSIESFAFNPKSLTVPVGTTVTWTNNDSANHRINSSSFNSPDLPKGSSFSYTFQTAGTFDYTCGVHPSMQGKVIVQ